MYDVNKAKLLCVIYKTNNNKATRDLKIPSILFNFEERERQRQRDRQAGRRTDRQTQTETQTDRQRGWAETET